MGAGQGPMDDNGFVIDHKMGGGGLCAKSFLAENGRIDCD